MVWFFSVCGNAMRTAAEVDFLPGNLFLHCQMAWFFPQTARADDKITDLLQVFLRIGDEYIGAPLATEVIFLAVIVRGCRLIPADLQPYQ